MQADQVLSFGPCRLDLGNGQLWRGTQAVKLTPKALAVLRYFVEHRGQLVTKEDLFQAVWSETVVSEATLASCIQELRQAFQDNARKPRYIETVHRRGYRFLPAITILPVSSQQLAVSSQREDSRDHSAFRTPHSALSLVGRETELQHLHGWLEKALRGERQLLFVTGEPGIGKTTLVEAFLQSLESRVQRPASKGQIPQPYTVQTLHPRHQTLDGGVWIGRGQCIEHYGAGEAYLPILEALGRLCRAPHGQHLITLLMQHAPTWLVQMPAVLTAAERETLQRTTAGATKERMLRELAEAVEVMTAERPVVLWLEDLHWGDYSTLDWLAFAARRREPCRLLVIGTYRPVEVLTREHPLKGVEQELQVHGQCEELALDFLREEDVAEYLAQRFAGGTIHESPLRRLAHLIHRRTDGNPLFMVTVVNDLMGRGVLVQKDGRWELQGGIEESIGGVPESLQQMIAQQVEQLNPADRRVLEVASVVGAEFSAAAVAAGVATPIEEVEEQCGEFARRKHFLRASGTDDWPDGTVAARYSFLHALYQEVLYDRLSARRRQRLHQQIGERIEQGYGERAKEIAAELAVHFERGREYGKAIQYLQQAGGNAARRSAHHEAIALFTKGLELLKTLPDTPERTQQELMLQVALGPPLQATKGYAAPEVEKIYSRARELCRQMGETPQLFWVLMGLSAFYQVRAEHQTARELAEQCLRLAQSAHKPHLLMWAHYLLGTILFFLGEFALAQDHLEQGMALYDPQTDNSLVSGALQDPKVSCLSYVAWVLCWLGYPDQALQRSHEALTLAQGLSHPFSLAFALVFTTTPHQLCGEWPAVQERVEALMTLCSEQGFVLWLAPGTKFRGWALVEQGQGEEGIAQIRQGLAAYQATGAEVGRPYDLALLAGALGKMGQAEEGLSALTEALILVNNTGERYSEAELYRLKGQLVLQSAVHSPHSTLPNPHSAIRIPQSQAEACFLKAVEIARKQQAKSLELRATTSLARLWQQQGKKKQARKMLAEVYDWFTEGFDTADLKEAKALLEELQG